MSENANAYERTQSQNKKRGNIGVRYLVQIGMLSAIAVILMLFEFPLWFAPNFYKIDLSEVPVLIGAFSMGPIAGILIELVKILLNFIINGTITAGVGEAANFIIGCTLVVPAGIIYRSKKSRKGAIIGLIVGILVMAAVGAVLNAFVLFPVYGKAFDMPIDALVGMGTAVNASITNLSTFVLFAVTPFNLLKGVVVSIVTILLYKYISPLLHRK